MNKFFSLVFLLFFLSCTDENQKKDLQKNEKEKIVLSENIIDKDYINKFEFRNQTFKKTLNKSDFKVAYIHQTEIWKHNNKIGVFYSVTYEYLVEDINRMENFFNGFIIGLKTSDIAFSDLKYVENYEFDFPFKHYKTFKILNSDNVKLGFLFNILKGKKIISILVNINDEFKIDSEKLIGKINEI
ncbi:hypothetical protein [Lacinutrix jangbogonensis]|uniref:hypothetical protein n=1 Tax=Lacinutrix jangbogonensis TaxID=1469557 RepID=UPI000ADF139D|nr:hypothetical protein [Lacinutrix jangbogonensis]